MDNIYIFYLPMLFLSAKAQYGLSTNEPFATRDKEFMLTCNISTSETSTVMIWNRNGATVVFIRVSDCLESDTGQGLYNLYTYNCSTSNRRYNLIIPSTRINNEADSQWFCGPSGGGTRSDAYTLQFYTSPTGNPVITGYDGSPRFPGNTVPLTCTVNGGIPLATLSWSCKGTPVPGTALGTSTHTVTIDTSYNGQRCTCTGSHPTWTVNKEVQSQVFVVHYKPTTDPVVSGYDGSVRYQGDTLTLTCQVSGGSPLATLSWTCDGQQQVASVSTSGTTVTSVLTLNLVSGHNGTTCICHGRHTDPSYKPDITSRTFIVYYPPSTPGLYPSQSTPFPWIEAGQGTLNCVSQPGYPLTITYQWIRENVVIQGQTGVSLILTSLTKNDYRKIYKCKVSNEYTVHKNEDLVSQPRLLDIKFSAIFNSRMKFFAELNGTVEVKIPFFCNPSVLSINNISIAKDNIDQKGKSDISLSLANTTLDISFHERVVSVNGQEIVLTFHSFTRDLQGTYTAGVKNLQEVSVSTFVFEVILSGPPVHPKDFKLVTSTADSVIFSWIAGNNGGLHQTFVISYKQTGKNDTLTTKNVTELKGKEMYLAVIADLLPNTKYNFWIYAYNSKGNSIQNIESTNSVTGKTILQEKYDNGINYNNGIGIGIVIGMIVGVFSTGLVVLILLWRKGIWNGIKCISGDASDNQLKMQDQTTHKEINAYDGINPLEEDVQNNQDSISHQPKTNIPIRVRITIQMQSKNFETDNNHEEYEDLGNRQDSPAYQELHHKGAEAIQLSSIYVNTIVK